MRNRTVSCEEIRASVSVAAARMNTELPKDVVSALENAAEEETGRARRVLSVILENLDVAERTRLPICQDTGTVIAFVDLGQSVHIRGGCLADAVEAGVADAYRRRHCRASVVSDPLFSRTNTGTNLPVVMHYKIHQGSRLQISLMAKGFGSENCSRTYMLLPTDGPDGVIRAICETMRAAGGRPCPPVVLGVGVGGTLEHAAVLSKRALLRPLHRRHPVATYADLEARALQAVNSLGIGPGGLGGLHTALAVKIAEAPTHIAGLPVAITVCCWADRRAVVTI